MKNTAIKKVFICITKSNWGGAQKYVYDLATSLPKDKFDIFVLLGGDGELKKKLIDENIKILSLKNSQRDANIFKDFGLFFELTKIFKKEKPDIIHLNSSKIGFIGVLAGRLSNIKKIIFTAHGWAFNEDRPYWQKFIFWSMQCKTVFFSHQTIAVSDSTKNQLRPKWLQNKITVIHNGINQLIFLDKELGKKELWSGIVKNVDREISKKKLIVTVSELNKNKGLEYAIKAFRKLEDTLIAKTDFIIIGEGGERNNLEKIICDLNLQDRVFLVGKIPDSYKYLRAFDIFTLTSTTEAFPYSILEAGLAGIPVIASNVGGIPEIIVDKETGFLVRPKNIDDIRLNMSLLLKNPEISNKLVVNLTAKIQTDFSFSKMIEKTTDIYTQ